MQKIAVIGGGITGVTTAYALAQRGLRVTLYEQHRYPAMETSFANGGQLSASNGETWTHRSTILKGLKWMLHSDAPLLVNPRPSWHKLSWFAEFVASMPRYRANTVQTARLAIAARQHLFAWAEAEGIDFDLKREGILHIYRDKAGFDHAAGVSKLLAQAGLPRRAVGPEEMRAIEPTLAGRYYGGFYTDSDSTGDIHKFCNGLAAAAQRLGVRFVFGQSVRRLTSDGRQASVVAAGDEGLQTERFDALVVCAGVGSRALAAQLGDRVRPLVAWVAQCFPGVGTRQVVPWAGLRPMMPDMMPRVGRGRRANVFYNTGHGHLGWTLLAATAELVAGQVLQAGIDVRPRAVGAAAAA
ncbi:MAG: FAD-dependent oxidoreductase [Burkholderiaceae bacterium]|jgi:D-amino-acid dehydrogenase